MKLLMKRKSIHGNIYILIFKKDLCVMHNGDCKMNLGKGYVRIWAVLIGRWGGFVTQAWQPCMTSVLSLTCHTLIFLSVLGFVV